MIPSMKAMSFVKGLAKAQSETEMGTKQRKELGKSLTQVRKMAARPGVKRDLQEELARLEDNIMNVAEMEKQILSKEDMDAKDLKFQIRDLKTKLSLTGAEGLKPSLDKISFLLGELTSRLETYTTIKTDREKRMEELEKKIKDKMDIHFKELMKIEEILERLEKKHESLKKSGAADKETLKVTEKKIVGLREKVIEKRAEIVEKKKQEMVAAKPHLPAMPEAEPVFQRSVPPPKMMFPKEPSVKHKMMFPKIPEYQPTKGNEFPMPPMPKPEKKGFVGWIKGLFGK